MIDEGARRLQEFKSGEEKRLEKEVLEKEIDDEKKRIAKEQQLARWQQDIDQSRALQINRKKQERQNEKMEEAETSHFLKEWCQVLDQQERDEHLVKRTAAIKLASEHRKQVEIQRRRTEETQRQQDQVAVRAKRAMEADTVEFHNYAESCIRDYAEEGKNVIPLIKELREFRKRVQE